MNLAGKTTTLHQRNQGVQRGISSTQTSRPRLLSKSGYPWPSSLLLGGGKSLRSSPHLIAGALLFTRRLTAPWSGQRVEPFHLCQEYSDQRFPALNLPRGRHEPIALHVSSRSAVCKHESTSAHVQARLCNFSFDLGEGNGKKSSC